MTYRMADDEAPTPAELFKGKDFKDYLQEHRKRQLAAAGFGGTLDAEAKARIKDEAIQAMLEKIAARDAEEAERNDPANAHRGQARIARILARERADEMRHVHGIGWHRWDGRRWAEDPGAVHATRAVLDVILAAKHRALDEHDKDLGKDAERCESAAGIDGVLRIASALEPFACTADQLDAQPNLLNCANGTLDLDTGTLRPHDPNDLITRCTKASYDPQASGGRWEAFLAQVLPDDDVRAYLQRVAGVALSGAVLEHILPILTGQGRNGKGVWYTTVCAALGDYAISAEPELLMHRGDSAHPTGTMDLMGRRFAVCSENDRDRRLAEAQMKYLTGGDTIRARRMYRDFVEFKPSHTVFLVTNHLPKVSGDDPAIWARLRVIPFDVVIPEEDQDPHLPEKLRAELPAILAWAVRGWQDYQRRGLDAPKAVLAATAEYQHEADAVARFIDDECEIGPGRSSTTEPLYMRWQNWAIREQIPPLSKKLFGSALDRHGYTARKGTGGIRYRQGIQLIPRPTERSIDLFEARESA
jgi:putative DNA primase/helicase